MLAVNRRWLLGQSNQTLLICVPSSELSSAYRVRIARHMMVFLFLFDTKDTSRWSYRRQGKQYAHQRVKQGAPQRKLQGQPQLPDKLA
jgi:hypothetical protein